MATAKVQLFRNVAKENDFFLFKASDNLVSETGSGCIYAPHGVAELNHELLWAKKCLQRIIGEPTRLFQMEIATKMVILF